MKKLRLKEAKWSHTAGYSRDKMWTQVVQFQHHDASITTCCLHIYELNLKHKRKSNGTVTSLILNSWKFSLFFHLSIGIPMQGSMNKQTQHYTEKGNDSRANHTLQDLALIDPLPLQFSPMLQPHCCRNIAGTLLPQDLCTSCLLTWNVLSSDIHMAHSLFPENSVRLSLKNESFLHYYYFLNSSFHSHCHWDISCNGDSNSVLFTNVSHHLAYRRHSVNTLDKYINLQQKFSCMAAI